MILSCAVFGRYFCTHFCIHCSNLPKRKGVFPLPGLPLALPTVGMDSASPTGQHLLRQIDNQQERCELFIP